MYPATVGLFPSGTQNGLPDVSTMLHHDKSTDETTIF